MTKFSSNPQFKALNWDVYHSEGVKNGSLKAKWAALLGGLVLLLGAHSGFGQIHPDTLYCQLQTRLEVGVELAKTKSFALVVDTLQPNIERFNSQNGTQFTRLLGEYHFWIGYAEFYKNYGATDKVDNQLGIRSLEIADSILSTIDHPGSDTRARCKRMQGMFQYFLEENVSGAQDYYESAYREWMKVPQKDSVEIAVVLQCLGQTATRLGEYNNAIDLYTQSLDLRKKIFGEMHPRVGMAYLNLGNAYAYSDAYEDAAKAYQKSLEIMTLSAEDDHLMIADITRNLAVTLGELGRYQEAIKYHLEAVSIQRKYKGSFAIDLIDYFSSLALDYSYIGNFTKAQQALSEMKRICEHHRFVDGDKVALYRFNKGRVLEHQHAASEAVIGEFQAAMSAIAPGWVQTDWNAYPPCNATSNPLFLQQIVLEKSSYLGKFGRTQPSRSDLYEASLAGFERAAELTNRLRQEYQDQDDKLFLSGQGSNYLQEALGNAQHLWESTHQKQYVARAFGLMENCKFQLLLEFFRQSQVQVTDEIDKETVFRLDSYRRRCAELDTRLALADMPKDSAKLYQSELLEKRLLLQALEDSLTETSQIFRTVNAGNSSIPLDTLERMLPKETAAIAFSLADSSLFVISVRSEGSSLRQTKLGIGFQDSVRKWIGFCRRPLESRDDIQEFGQLGHSLYQILLEPEIQQIGSIRHLLIIPDGVLGNLPFEALVTEPTTPKRKNLANFPYLLRDFRCSYAASATLWADQQLDRSEQKPLECLGIAWGNDPINELAGKPVEIPGLTGTERELKILQEMVAGNFFVGKESSEAVFKRLAPHYGILHLALHARATQADPQILFPASGNPKEDGILHFHELFQIKLNARLAVLSACETGAGKLIQGEGIQSISSGFAAAGVPSLLLSLWEVDDRSGQKLMEGFYRGMQSGMPLDEALQQAKIEYLSKADGEQAAPFYWAAFVPMGNMKPIQLASAGHVNWYLIAIFATVPLCIFIGYRIYSKKRKST